MYQVKKKIKGKKPGNISVNHTPKEIRIKTLAIEVS